MRGTASGRVGGCVGRAGGCAGAIANTICYPFDFARTRLASDLGAGKAQFKVTVYTDTPRYYDAYLPRKEGEKLSEAPNAIIRTAAVIAEFEQWAYRYRVDNTYEGPWGRIVPNASINAIRSGYPYNMTSTPQICAFYVNTRILPGASPLDIKAELEGLLGRVGVEGDVELIQYRPGFEVKGAGGQTLGRHGYSKDHRPDLRQMILAVLIDGDGQIGRAHV